uniref:Uncharacterized protein n=1 Tax=Arundo donax TaxID=35708 RepID=A0A0A8Y3Z3_ARUDO
MEKKMFAAGISEELRQVYRPRKLHVKV